MQRFVKVDNAIPAICDIALRHVFCTITFRNLFENLIHSSFNLRQGNGNTRYFITMTTNLWKNVLQIHFVQILLKERLHFYKFYLNRSCTFISQSSKDSHKTLCFYIFTFPLSIIPFSLFESMSSYQIATASCFGLYAINFLSLRIQMTDEYFCQITKSVIRLSSHNDNVDNLSFWWSKYILKNSTIWRKIDDYWFVSLRTIYP